MNIYSIYKVTCLINNKIYIGFDSNWPRRTWEHKYKHTKEDSKFYRALRKHSFKNFKWEVIYQSSDREHTLKVMEPFFIKEYNSFKKGYNSTVGGDGVSGLKPSKKQLDSVRRPITLNGVVYKSRTEALKKLKINWHDLYRLEKGLPIKVGNGNGALWGCGNKNPNSKPIIIMGIFYQSKTEAKQKLNIGDKLLNKIINENLDYIPQKSLRKSQNSIKGFANKMADNQVYHTYT